MAARRVPAECGTDYQCKRTRASNRTTSALNTNADAGDWQRRKKRITRRAFQSDDSAESDGEEYARNASDRKKQCRNKKRSRHYDENYAGIGLNGGFSKTQNKKDAKRSYASGKYCDMRIERKYATAKRRRNADSSGDSDTATLTVTETSDTTTSSSSKNNCHHKIRTKYRSYDDIVCKSDCVDYTKCKRNISEEILPPKKLTLVQKYTPGNNNKQANARPFSISNKTTTASTNEMLKFVNNLFRQLGNNANSGMIVNKTFNVGQSADSSQRMTQIVDNSINQSVTPPKSNMQFAASEVYGTQYSGAQLVNAAISHNPRKLVLPEGSTKETKPSLTHYTNQNEIQTQFSQTPALPQRYIEQGRTNSIATALTALADPADYSNSNQPQKYAFAQYLPTTQAQYAPTSNAHEQNARATLQQQQPYAPIAMTQTYVAANTTPTAVQPAKFAHSMLATQSTSENFAPNNFTTHMQSQGNMLQRTAPTPSHAMQINRAGSNGQQTTTLRMPLPPLQSLEYVDHYNSGRQEYVLSRSPPMPQIESNTTNENLLGATYIAPRPTEANIAAEQRNKSELNSPKNTSEQQVSAARQAEAQPSNLIVEHANGIADAYYTVSDTHMIAGNINRTQMRVQAVDRLQFPIIANRVEENLNYKNNSSEVKESETYEQANANEANTRNSQNNASKREGINIAEDNKQEEVKMNDNPKEKRRKSSNKQKILEHSDESSDEEDTNSTCSSDYIRECMRKRRHKRKHKHTEKYRPHTKKRKYKRKDAYESDSDSEQTSDDYAERRCSYTRGRGKRHKHYEAYTTSGSESDDEMDYSLSKTSCKQLKKCCSRIVAICRMARDTAGTQTDECCDCGQTLRNTMSQAQCSSSSSSKLERDIIQRRICEGLANADQNAMRKIVELNRDKKKCKVYTCGVVGENGAPIMKNDMIILKFEEDEDAKRKVREQQKNVASVTACASDCTCDVTINESESEIIKALIRRKRIYEKIQKACSLTRLNSDACDCTCADETEVEHEFMDDLLRKQRLERAMQNNCEDCVCGDIDKKAKEMAAEVMKEMIRNHIRTMCAAELADSSKNVASLSSESEERIARWQSAMQKKQEANSSSESCAECLCELESQSKIVNRQLGRQKIVQSKTRDIEIGVKSNIQPGDCTCSRKKNKQIPQRRNNETERQRIGPTGSARTMSSGSIRASKVNVCASDCACCIDKNEYRPTNKQQRSVKSERVTSNNSRVSGKANEKINARASGCTCNDSNKEMRTAKGKTEKPKRIIEIAISATSEMSAARGVREDNRNACTSNCTCKPHKQSESAQLKSRRTQISLASDSSEMSVERRGSVRGGNCTCKPPKQSAKLVQIPRALNIKASGNTAANVSRQAREDKTNTIKRTVKTISPKPSDYSSYGAENCRRDCTCKGTSKPTNAHSKRNLSETISDYEVQTSAKNPSDSRSKKTRESEAGSMSKRAIKRCRPDCACKQTEDLNDTEDDIDERIIAKPKTVDSPISEDDESLGDDSEHKSIQKLIIDIKASKQARASCTLITYPQTSKNNERHKSAADYAQSTNSNASNEQRATLCAELALNELLPQHSLRTLLTKLASPNGKLFYSNKLESSLPEDGMNTFSMDQSKVLSLQTGRNGKVKPTMIMSQAIRVTGKNPMTTHDADLEPLQYYKKKVLKLSSSAPSLVTSQELTTEQVTPSKIRNSAGHAEPADAPLQNELSSSMQKQKKSLIPVAEKNVVGKHLNESKLLTLTQSDSAETRANARPVINQTSDSNHHITRLWPEQAAQGAQQTELRRAKQTLSDDKCHAQKKRDEKLIPVMSTESQFNTELAMEKYDKIDNRSTRPRLESGTQLPFEISSSSTSSSKSAQATTKNKKKSSHSTVQRSPVNTVNILDAANRSQLYAKASSASSASNFSQQPNSQHNNTHRKYSSRKTAKTKLSTETPTMYSSHSIDYVERQNSATVLPTCSKKNRITRFSTSNDEQQHSDSEGECISLDYTNSKSDQYEIELERKRKLWRKGTVKEALEVEEQESERSRHWQRTTLTGDSLERAIHYPTSVWNEERRQLNMKRNGGGIFGPF